MTTANPEAGEQERLAEIRADLPRRLHEHRGYDCWTVEFLIDLLAARDARIAVLELALDWSLKVIFPSEPPDSRAVSDEFVSAASIQAGNHNQACIEILQRALAAPAAAETKGPGDV